MSGELLNIHVAGKKKKVPAGDQLPPIYDEWKKRIARINGYTIKDDGQLCYIKETEKKDGTKENEIIPIANFVARPVYEITRDDGRTKTKSFVIEGVVIPGELLPSVEIAAKDFLGMKWLYDAWGTKANIKPGHNMIDRMRHAIQGLNSDTIEQIIYTHLGWRQIDGKWVYLHVGGAIGADNVMVDIEDGLQRYKLPEKSDRMAMEDSLRLLEAAPREITIPLFALVYLAPLCEALRQAGCEPAFVMWLYGISGAMKSTLAALFLCHFGAFDNKNLPASFRDTANDIEVRAYLTKDSMLTIDDYHPTDDIESAKVMKRTAQAILRGYGDRVGKGRRKADLTAQKRYVPQGMCLITGEDIPNTGQSSAARYITVEVKKGDVDKAILSECQANISRLSEAMRGYIEWLISKMDDIPQKLKEKFEEYRHTATVESQHGRMPEAVACLYIGLSAGLQYAVEVGVITNDEQKELLDDGWRIFTKLAEKQNQRIKENNPSELFCNTLQDILNSGEGHLLDAESSCSDPGKGCLGWVGKDLLYLISSTAYAAVRQQCRNRGINFPLTEHALWEYLHRAGLVGAEKVKDQKTKGEYLVYARQKKLGNKNRRVIWLQKSAVFPEDS